MGAVGQEADVTTSVLCAYVNHSTNLIHHEKKGSRKGGFFWQVRLAYVSGFPEDRDPLTLENQKRVCVQDCDPPTPRRGGSVS